MGKELSVCGERSWTVLDRRCQHSHRSQHPSANILSSLVMGTGTNLSNIQYPMSNIFILERLMTIWLSLKVFLPRLLAGGQGWER